MQHPNWHEEIPLLKNLTYLANCSRSPLHIQVKREVDNYLNSWATEGAAWEKWLEVIKQTRVEIARLINADPGDIAISSSVSGAISGLMSALNWEGQRNQVVSAEDEISALNLIINANEKWGTKRKLVPGNEGLPSLSEYGNYINESTLLVAGSHVCYKQGRIQDLEEFVRITHNKGARLLINASLSAGTVPIDVKNLGVDFLVGTTAKYLMGPPGLAFIYVNPRLISDLKPSMTGWFGQEFPFSFEPRVLDYANGARRLETGTPSIINGYGSLAGLRIINNYQPQRIDQERRELIKKANEMAKDLGFPGSFCQDNVFMSIPTRGARQIERRLKEKGIIASSVGDYLRLAPHFFTQASDFEKVFKELKPLIGTKQTRQVSSYSGGGEKEFDLGIKNGQIVIPGNAIFRGDVCIKGSKIAGIASNIAEKAEKVIDAEGKYILPGIIDPHIHLGLFAPMEEDFISETRSALIGGVTTAGLFIGGEGSHNQRLKEICEGVNNYSHIDIWPHLVINYPEQLAELDEYIGNGIRSFKMYMCGIPGMIPDADDGFIYQMLKKLQNTKKGIPLCIHAENSALVAEATEEMSKKGLENGTLADWAKTHPNFAEAEAVRRALYLNKNTGVPLYFVHISTKESIEVIQEEKLKPNKNRFYVETTPFYLGCNNTDPAGLLAKMIPPLREQESVDALWEGIQKGLVDTIGTDNTSQNLEVKNLDGGMWGAMPGYPAMATSLPVILNEGVNKGRISIEKVSMLMSRKPAEIFGLYPQKGSLLPGSDADIAIIDLDREKKVHHRDLKSAADFSVFEGRVLKGWPIMTIKNGRVVMQDGEIIEEEQHGNFLLRK